MSREIYLTKWHPYQSVHTSFDPKYFHTVRVLFYLFARRWWYKVVVIVVVIATSCSSPLPPVTADLLVWSSAIWRYTKSHYSVGHGLDEEERNTSWGMIKEGSHSPHWLGDKEMGERERRIRFKRRKGVKFRIFGAGAFRLLELCVGNLFAASVFTS